MLSFRRIYRVKNLLLRSGMKDIVLLPTPVNILNINNHF